VHDFTSVRKYSDRVHLLRSILCHKEGHLGLRPRALANGVSTRLSFCCLIYRFPKRWLHTLIIEFMSAYNRQIYMCFSGKSRICNWNDAMACARHTVSLQGSTWNLIMALNLQKKCSRAMAHVRNTQYKTNIGKSGQSLTRINFSCQKLSLLFSLCYRLWILVIRT